MSKLTHMQAFFLETINAQAGKDLRPTYLAAIYYSSIGKRTRAASRDSFGQTSAAYRTCRKLAQMGLIKETIRVLGSGFSDVTYTAKAEVEA